MLPARSVRSTSVNANTPGNDLLTRRSSTKALMPDSAPVLRVLRSRGMVLCRWSATAYEFTSSGWTDGKVVEVWTMYKAQPFLNHGFEPDLWGYVIHYGLAAGALAVVVRLFFWRRSDFCINVKGDKVAYHGRFPVAFRSEC